MEWELLAVLEVVLALVIQIAEKEMGLAMEMDVGIVLETEMDINLELRIKANLYNFYQIELKKTIKKTFLSLAMQKLYKLAKKNTTPSRTS